jgi:hypothetical protein
MQVLPHNRLKRLAVDKHNYQIGPIFKVESISRQSMLLRGDDASTSILLGYASCA